MKKIYFKISFLFAALFGTLSYAQNFDKALNLNGSSNYLTVPNNSNAIETINFSFECWVKRATSVSQFGKDRLFMSINNDGWGVYIEANKLKITKVGVSEASSVGTIADTLWHHLAVTFNGTEDTVVFYIDGELDSKAKFNYSFSSTGNYSIGSRGAGEYFAGKIEELKVWSVVRSALDISMNKCTILNGNETGLNRYYKFNEGSGSSIIDASVNAQNGTLTSGSNVWVNSSLTCTNSINEKSSYFLDISPNPTNNVLFIKNENFSKSYSISIYSLTGSFVKYFQLSSGNEFISVEDLNPGIYFVKSKNVILKFIKI
jgi:hypothetical protein